MNYRLTQYSHGAGCGCKISPKVLEEILHGAVTSVSDERLIVGNDTRDDAAVFDLGDGTGIVSTTDFFMPIVDDPVDFGRIASVNAISDIYAMGGTPLMAIAVLGWPVNTVPIEAAKLVLDGARLACNEAGIPLAGGHSIDAPEPIFGLAVTGRVPLTNLRINAGAKDGDVLFLTKPLGVGILTTAEKKGVLRAEHLTLARDTMVQLNRAGAVFGGLPYVHAMTDVTGFGLLGHLIEMCEGSGLYAEINVAAIPLIDESLHEYIAQGSIPGGTMRNFDSYGHKVSYTASGTQGGTLPVEVRAILCDPQTSGGLLVAVDPDKADEFVSMAAEHGVAGLEAIGRLSNTLSGILSPDNSCRVKVVG
ncbi:MAG: selenide, water dikinase SelD [Ignavibacteriae bacterium]|nr:MAG: selenide, water dikinase SelD [Ignavibacteriota bacterium]